MLGEHAERSVVGVPTHDSEPAEPEPELEPEPEPQLPEPVAEPEPEPAEPEPEQDEGTEVDAPARRNLSLFDDAVVAAALRNIANGTGQLENFGGSQANPNHESLLWFPLTVTEPSPRDLADPAHDTSEAASSTAGDHAGDVHDSSGVTDPEGLDHDNGSGAEDHAAVPVREGREKRRRFTRKSPAVPELASDTDDAPSEAVPMMDYEWFTTTDVAPEPAQDPPYEEPASGDHAEEDHAEEPQARREPKLGLFARRALRKAAAKAERAAAAERASEMAAAEAAEAEREREREREEATHAAMEPAATADLSGVVEPASDLAPMEPQVHVETPEIDVREFVHTDDTPEPEEEPAQEPASADPVSDEPVSADHAEEPQARREPKLGFFARRALRKAAAKAERDAAAERAAAEAATADVDAPPGFDAPAASETEPAEAVSDQDSEPDEAQDEQNQRNFKLSERASRESQRVAKRAKKEHTPEIPEPEPEPEHLSVDHRALGLPEPITAAADAPPRPWF
jgi:hypothetical protein